MKQSILITTITFSLLAPQTADAGVYYPNYKILNEVNGTQTTNTARSAVASGIMGVKGYGNLNLAINTNELPLLMSCKSMTMQPSSWPEQCNIDGLAKALTAKAPGQSWLSASYTKFQQTEAINKLANNMINYGSPSLIPLYGQADHFATVAFVNATVDNNSIILNQVGFYDAGYGVDQDFNMQFDNGGMPYSDGVIVRHINVFKGEWYLLLTGVAQNDQFYDKYVMAYDPPIKTAKEPQIEHAEPLALADSADMNAETARDLAFEALARISHHG
jgi:hypothetical protein